MKSTLRLAIDIRDTILDDILDRKGWRQEWYDFDDDGQEEIRLKWRDMIKAILDAEQSK